MNLDSLITTCKPYLGEVHPFLGVLSQLQRHGLSLKIYSTVLNLNIVSWIIQDKFEDEKLLSNAILVTYIAENDFKNLREQYIDYIHNSEKFFYRIDAVYDNVEKRFTDIDILKGNEDYAN